MRWPRKKNIWWTHFINICVRLGLNEVLMQTEHGMHSLTNMQIHTHTSTRHWKFHLNTSKITFIDVGCERSIFTRHFDWHRLECCRFSPVITIYTSIHLHQTISACVVQHGTMFTLWDNHRSIDLHWRQTIKVLRIDICLHHNSFIEH